MGDAAASGFDATTIARGFDRTVKTASILSFLLRCLALVPDQIGLLPSLNVLNSILLAVVLSGLWFLHEDLDDLDAELRTDGEDMSTGDSDPTADGGIRLSTRLREFRDASPDGAGAVAGTVAGGSLGLLGGPIGVVVGGIAGGLLGNEVEYRRLVTRYRDELAATAKHALRRERTVQAVPPFRTVSVDRRGDDGHVVTLSDADGQTHRIRLDVDERTYQYEGH